MDDIKDEEFTETVKIGGAEGEDNECFHYLKIKPGHLSMDFQILEECRPNDTVLITGHLKWDGCMNWKSDPTYMYHFCDMNDAKTLTDCFAKLYSVGSKFIVRWDGD